MVRTLTSAIGQHRRMLYCTLCLLLLANEASALPHASDGAGLPSLAPAARQSVVAILGTTLDSRGNICGVVVQVHILFHEREDREGLRIRFRKGPGRFSVRSQRAVLSATVRAADAAGLRTDSWSMSLTLLQPGATLYGESLSAMVGLSAVALARGDPLPPDRTITGTITASGRIGMVGGVPHKIRAAHDRRVRRVMIPEQLPQADGDWQTPFLMHVSPVGNLRKAYLALTDRPM